MRKLLVLLFLAAVSFGSSVLAQQTDISISTVTREPFSMERDGEHVGFSIELFQELAKRLDLTATFVRTDSFGEMLAAVETGAVDGAIANISITAARETVMDFTQPIFDSGLQIMVPFGGQRSSIFSALLTWDIFFALAIAILLLFGGGMLMWVFERNASDYFRRPAKDAAFPAFWWALNLVVNGGFEERMPQSRAGRGFAVLLVVSSLFVVSVFVATITAAMTVNALKNEITSLSDLEGKRVGTIGGSTASTFLLNRDINFIELDNLEEMYRVFEAGDLDAVVFDKPILDYYVTTRGQKTGRMLDPIFKPENYSIALPTDSSLLEPLNQTLLRLREDGTYDSLRAKWFGVGR
ncbi:MAG: transporter substrate-binding domain-containing protein [Tateyamaria sp.]|uniref:transporter substrate-binding domain-containing protein n=1 Tax=Tateyamaria sp. TaxID=1929288 RepID=UPI00329BA80C